MNELNEISHGVRYVGFDIDENLLREGDIRITNDIDTNLLQEGDVVIMDTNEMLLWDGMSWITFASTNTGPLETNEWFIEENIFIEDDENEAYFNRIGV